MRQYRGKISGPLLDRIDLHVEVSRPPRSAMRVDATPGVSSRVVAARVLRARRRQVQKRGLCNAMLAGERLAEACRTNVLGEKLLDDAADKFALSVRAYQRILRVARTIADLDAAETITPLHITEALSLRGIESTETR